MNKTFANIPSQYADPKTAKILLQSIPYDGTSTWGKGADKGFDAFLDAAENMELYDIETNTEVYKQGIFVPQPLGSFNSPEAMFTACYSLAKEQLESSYFPTYFGGEHSISIGIIKAFYEAHPDISILQIDAHADLRPSYDGSPYNHACALYDASKNCNLVQVGIRSMDVSEEEHMDRYNVFFAEDMHQDESWINESIRSLGEKVYITLDLDALDPSIMPATGTPEPGGLQWYTLLKYLRMVFETKNVLGFDIVELAPIDGLHAPQFLVAKLYYKMLSYKFL